VEGVPRVPTNKNRKRIPIKIVKNEYKSVAQEASEFPLSKRLLDVGTFLDFSKVEGEEVEVAGVAPILFSAVTVYKMEEILIKK